MQQLLWDMKAHCIINTMSKKGFLFYSIPAYNAQNEFLIHKLFSKYENWYLHTFCGFYVKLGGQNCEPKRHYKGL